MNGVKAVVGLACALIVTPAMQVHAQAVDEARVESMDLALKTLAEDSAPTTWGAIYELLGSAVYFGGGVHLFSRPQADGAVIIAGSLSLAISGIYLASAGYTIFGASTAEQARYSAFTALRQRGPVSLAAMRVLEGELYAQALSAHYRRRGVGVGALGLMLAGVATLAVGFATPEVKERVLVAWLGGGSLVLGGFLLYSSTMESTEERLWREYHEGHLRPSRVPATARVAIAPYASATGAGLALSAQM